jgi:hypothetical protein
MIIKKVNNDIIDIDLISSIGSSGVSTYVSTNARRGDILLLALTRPRFLEWSSLSGAQKTMTTSRMTPVPSL